MVKQNKRFGYLVLITVLVIIGHGVAVYSDLLTLAYWLRNITYILTLAIGLLLIARWLQVRFRFFDAEKWKKFKS